MLCKFKILHVIVTCFSYPAKTAPTAEMNHSAELNPKMATL